MKIKGEFSYLSNGTSVFVPDVQIKEDKPDYCYEPALGYSGSLIVFDLDDNCIGWIDPRVFGCENAKEWMLKNKYIPLS